MSTTPTQTKVEQKQAKAVSIDPATFVSRRIASKVLSREQAEGVGARVRRSIGTGSMRNFDPFLMLDEFRVGPPAGFPDHPHRGFETVTYMIDGGSFSHEDFCGHKGTITPGDLQWMTAGKGIVHSEMPASTGMSHGLQLWVNLAAKDKLCAPAYQELKSADIPHVSKNGVSAVVIAGEALGVVSPVYTRTPTYYIHFKMQPNSVLRQHIPEGWNAFCYTLGGEAYIGSDRAVDLVEPHHAVFLGKEGSGVIVHTKDKDADFVVLSGQPIGEPIVQHGPFVMNTQQEIMQALTDYQQGQNGFERAPGWRSEIGRPITDRLRQEDD